MIDLGLIVADKTMAAALKGILDRPEALGIRAITSKTIVLPGRDSRVRTVGPDQLALLYGKVRHGIVMLDFEGSGAKGNALELEAELNRQIQTKWTDDARAIVIDPELDSWIWGSNNVLNQIIDTSIPDLRVWLEPQGFQFDPNQKPSRPKEAIERVLREIQQPITSTLYHQITAKLSLKRCVDPAFLRLSEALRLWFAPVRSPKG